MKLKKEQIAHLAKQILKKLEQDKTAVFDQTSEQILRSIESVITQNFLEEDAIDAEVRRLMASYEKQIASGAMDRQKVFQMIKKEIVKQRNFVV